MSDLTIRNVMTLLERVLNRLPEDAAYGLSASTGTRELHLNVRRDHVETALSVLGMNPTPDRVWPMDCDPRYEHVSWTGQVDGITVALATWRPITCPQGPVATSAENPVPRVGAEVAS